MEVLQQAEFLKVNQITLKNYKNVSAYCQYNPQ